MIVHGVRAPHAQPLRDLRDGQGRLAPPRRRHEFLVARLVAPPVKSGDKMRKSSK
jgi:hypothetical protein